MEQAIRCVEEAVQGVEERLSELYTALEASTVSLRDRFAMAALQGLLGARSLPMGHIEGVAEEAYWFADAMLRAREGR